MHIGPLKLQKWNFPLAQGKPMFRFYIPTGFLLFSEGIEREHWSEIG